MNAVALACLLLAQSGIAVFDGSDPVAPGETPAAFKNAAELRNGRITLVVEKGAVQLRSGAVVRAALHLKGVEKFDRVSLVEHGKGAATLEVAGGAVTAKFRIKKGDIAVEVQPGAGAERLKVEVSSRFVVLPDFFADDIVIDARGLPAGTAEIPSENFLLQPVGTGEALVMTVFENKEQEVRLTLNGTVSTASEIEFGKNRKIWVALLEAPRIWHVADVQAGDAGKATALDWTMPFAAAWRCDLTRANGLADSWEMLLRKEKDGAFIKPSWMGGGDEKINADRKRWTTVLGTFPYPVWSEPDGKGWLQPIKHDKLSFRGPALIYPVNRVEATPPAAFTVVDVVRNTLGAGPCEYLLDLEGNKAEYKGRATCSSRDVLTKIYKEGQQKAKHDEVEKVLQDGLVFVTHIRGRITRYVDFAHGIRASLAAQKKAHPELEKPLAELDAIAAEIDARFAAREEKMKTPAHVAKMNDEFRKNVMDYDGPDALERCKAYAKALVEIGDNQDELSGECRWVVKALRQKAGLLMAADPKMAPIALEIRAKTQEVLRNPANHEGARH